MLAPSDVLELPPGVEAREGRLADHVRGVSVPLNPAALLVVSAAGRPLGAIAGDLASAFAIPRARALDDVLAFAWQLNRLGLANTRPGIGLVARSLAWLVLALRLLPAGTVPPTRTRRVALDTRTPLRAAADAARGLAGRAAGLGLAVAVLVLPAVSVAGGSAATFALALGAGTAAALVAHEAGHAAALTGLPAALVVGWRRVSVVHGPLGARRARLVAATGPLAAGLAGLALAVSASVTAVPELGIAGLPLAGHAVGLLAFTTDGRKACDT